MNEYLNVIRHNYATFQGRARRREYWLFTLINTTVILLLQIPVQEALLAVAARQGDSELGRALGGASVIFGLLLAVSSLAVLLPSVAVTVRRLHDAGRSGWWFLLNVVPFGSLVILVFCVMDGEPGSNRWGPNPKGMNQASAVGANHW